MWTKEKKKKSVKERQKSIKYIVLFEFTHCAIVQWLACCLIENYLIDGDYSKFVLSIEYLFHKYELVHP